jgi:hypothetical protein
VRQRARRGAGTLEEAFEDNESPSAAVGIANNEVSLAVLVPALDQIVPNDWPSQTQAGDFFVRELSARERNAFYTLFVYSQVLVTVREAMAVAPGIGSARVVVLRKERIDAYGHPRVSCVLAARFDRRALDGVRWHSVDAAVIVNDVSAECVLDLDGRGELRPVDLAAEPALRTLIEAADLD